jgi:long-chain fatty acid transport protein
MHDKKFFSRSLLTIACGATLITFGPQALASGFAIPELNTAGLALSNALVANPEVQAAIAYNPAAMSFHEGKSLALGLLLVKPDLAVDTGSGSKDSDANDRVAIPSITAHSTLSENWAIGVAVNAPFGLETEWADGTLSYQPADADGYPIGSAIPTKSKLQIVALSPSVSYKFNDNVSLAGGVDVYDMREVVFNSVGNAGTPGSNPAVNLKGDGRGAGFNLGLMVKQGNWSFGGSYHSEAHIPVEGNIESPAGTANVNADLDLPSRLQLGVRHQTTEKLGIEFDYTRTGWSSFDQLIIDESQYGVNLVTSTNNWDDANAYRLGATYDISLATQLRVGYTFDETPQDDDYFSPRIPDADRQLFSLGIGHTLSNGWTIDAGYMYVKFDDRTVNSTKTAADNNAVLGYPETNGTTAVNGTYESSVHLLSLGVTKKFM